jgi:hypothetical protein
VLLRHLFMCQHPQASQAPQQTGHDVSSGDFLVVDLI